jgi:hypothetical protein
LAWFVAAIPAIFFEVTSRTVIVVAVKAVHHPNGPQTLFGRWSFIKLHPPGPPLVNHFIITAYKRSGTMSKAFSIKSSGRLWREALHMTDPPYL